MYWSENVKFQACYLPCMYMALFTKSNHTCIANMLYERIANSGGEQNLMGVTIIFKVLSY